MKWAVSFPEESILLVRPCLVALCAGNRPAAKLLSVLLYRYSIRQEHKTDAENINEVRAANGEASDQDTTFRIYRKQSQLVADMCDEITEKTLHDVAVPVLQLFGYLDVDESPAIHCYDVHIDVVVEALGAYKQGPKALETFLLAHLQLEKFLIDIQLEKFPINKKYFQLALEKVLIANRNFSNNKRGRKPRPEVPPEAQSEEPQISLEIDSKISNKESTLGANAPARAHLKADIEEAMVLVDETLEVVEEETAKREAVTIGASHGNNTLVHPGPGIRHNHGLYPTEDHEQITSQQQIGATHGVDRRSGPDDLPRGASSGSADARDRADDARQGHAATAPVIPKRPRGKKPRAEPEPAPKFDLTAEQQHFWSLWCGVWFNQDIPPEMTETAYKHVVKLAPHITTAELLNSLIAYTRKDLQETQGIKRKAVQLGNCVNSYRGWKQVQREETPPQDEPNIGRNGLDLNQYGLQALLERQAAAEGV